MGSDRVTTAAAPVHVHERGESIDLTEKHCSLSTMRRTNSCLSVSTLKASLGSIDSIKNPKKKMTKQVSFHNLQIREYNIELGDNPSCRFGPPVTIGWDYSEANEILLDDMMSDGNEEKKERKLLDVHTRYDILRDAGFSDKDIMKTVKDVSIIRKQRYKSVSNEKYDKINERIENISRKFKKLGIGKLKGDDGKANNAPKMSRSLSLNSLSLKLPRKNSMQNLQLPSTSHDPLAITHRNKEEYKKITTLMNVETDSKSAPISTMDDPVEESQSAKENVDETVSTNSMPFLNIVDETQDGNGDDWGFFD